MNGAEAYGLWPLVVLNTGLFIIFAARFGPAWVAYARCHAPIRAAAAPAAARRHDRVGEPTTPTHRRHVHPGLEV